MSQKVKGNTKGLRPSQLREIQRLFHRNLAASEIVSNEFARELWKLASGLNRRIGALITREGRVAEIIVGSYDILYLPDLGRYRVGEGRLRRLRFIFSDLSSAEWPTIPHDVYTDLEKLRFDAVMAIKERRGQMAGCYAHFAPSGQYGGSEQEPVTTEDVPDLGLLSLDFRTFIEELEDELSLRYAQSLAPAKNGAILVGIYPRQQRRAEQSMNELRELARTAGVTVLDTISQRRTPDPRTLLGKGKLEEVMLQALRLGAELIIFDTELRPAQWRIITNSTEYKILDRSMLILDIFAQRAKSSEGRLQVELAQLQYNLPRLVEKDAGLSRLTGGIGGRGPGETKLEIGRRRMRDRIGQLEKKIATLSKQRALRRKRRLSNAVPLVAIIGYTNAGKSTLFNALTSSTVTVENKLFATLDPAQGRFFFFHQPSEQGDHKPVELVLSDTVGFIRELPKELANAFRATLEELYAADLLLHVLDASDSEIADRKRSVEQVLESMDLLNVPQITLLNKTDLVDNERARLLENEFDAIAISATKRMGFEPLQEAIGDHLVQAMAAQAFN